MLSEFSVDFCNFLVYHGHRIDEGLLTILVLGNGKESKDLAFGRVIRQLPLFE